MKKRVRPLVQINRSTALLTKSSRSPFRALRELLEAARTKPRSVSVGNYSPCFLASPDSIARAAGVEFNNIPYEGASPALTDVVGGTLIIEILESPEFEAFNRANGNAEIVAGDRAALSRQIDAKTRQLRASLGKTQASPGRRIGEHDATAGAAARLVPRRRRGVPPRSIEHSPGIN